MANNHLNHDNSSMSVIKNYPKNMISYGNASKTTTQKTNPTSVSFNKKSGK